MPRRARIPRPHPPSDRVAADARDSPANPAPPRAPRGNSRISAAGDADPTLETSGTAAGAPFVDARAATAVLSGLTEIATSLAGSAPDVDALFGMTTRVIREGAGFHHVSIWRRTQSRLDPVGVSGPSAVRIGPADAQRRHSALPWRILGPWRHGHMGGGAAVVARRSAASA